MEANACYVYVIFGPDGHPCYVGKGSGQRWRDHSRRRNTNPALAAMTAANGGELPTVIVRGNLPAKQALEIERALIAAIGRTEFGGPLVNRAIGGGNAFVSMETRRKMSEAHKGRKKSPEHQAAINRAISGVPKTKQHLENFRRARIGVSTKPASEERKAKASEASAVYWKRWRTGGIARRMNNGKLSEATKTDRGTADSSEREVPP